MDIVAVNSDMDFRNIYKDMFDKLNCIEVFDNSI